MQAILPNDTRLLRPGMFAQVTVALAEQRDVVTVPATAISYSPQGDAVFVVVEPPAVATPEAPTASGGTTGDGTQAAPGSPPPTASLPTVRRTLVQVGERRGTDVAILAGVAAGERVVTAGQIKLYDGPAVFIAVEVVPTENVLDVIGRVRAVLPDIQRNLPQGIEGQAVYDATVFIEQSIREVITNLVQALVIVTVVIFLFLGSLRAVLAEITWRI